MAFSSPFPMPPGMGAPQIPQPNGWAGKMSGMAGNNQNMLLQLGMGLLDKRQNNNVRFTDIAQQAMAGRQADQQRQTDNMTERWLMRERGLTREQAQEARANPVILAELMKGPKDPIEVSEGASLYDNGQWIQPPGGGVGKPTDDMRELNQINVEREAQSQPPLSLLDYQMGRSRAGAGGTRTPTGWQPIDETNPRAGIEPMPHGPGEQIPAEVGARIAAAQVAEAAMKDIDSILTEQTLTPAGIAKWATNSGDYGRAQRAVTLAVESALRAMTGAAAPDSEVARYANIFQPTPLESPETIKQKLGLLRQFIAGAREMATRGRGGPSDIGGADEEGWTDYGDGVRIREMP